MTHWFVPANDASVPPPTEASLGVQQSSVLSNKRVVIVEDEGITVWQMRKMLTIAGLQVVGAAPDGVAGVEMVLRERPEIVLMDVSMPRMDGLEATQHILAEFAVCLVIVTAYDQHRDEAERLGASGYIVKPGNRDTLLPALEAAYRTFTTRGHDA